MYTILNIHAPTEEKAHEVKDDFYDELESILENISETNYRLN